MSVDTESVLWAYRLFLDREPEDENYAQRAASFKDRKVMREHFLTSAEYLLKNGKASEFKDVVALVSLQPYGSPGRLFINLSDSVGLNIAQGSYEQEEVAFVKANLRPGQTFVDLGGNIGFYSILASAIVGTQGKVFTFEPLTINIETIRRSIGENSFATNIHVEQAIVGDRPRNDMAIIYQTLEDGSGNSGGSFIAPVDSNIKAHLRREPVRQEMLDTFLSDVTAVDFIKMDIEGAEVLAMRGAKEIFKKFSPIILSEVHTNQLELVSGANWREYFALMHSYGYKPHFFSGGRITNPVGELADGAIYNVAFLKI